ncbi:hypothetical protein D0817_01470 [Flavobacterium cupreum]|uniref:Uncharacterized protein n=1 Tax=Flavobacterium cupreum TaxID=2133766 RepID=A0A434AD52_9FLAO|nr:hypothetical protein D0817_01470 [Flavobacterium cupreum]
MASVISPYVEMTKCLGLVNVLPQMAQIKRIMFLNENFTQRRKVHLHFCHPEERRITLETLQRLATFCVDSLM